MKYIDNRINANIVKLEDENNNYMSEDVEGALEEIDSKIKDIEANGYDDTQIKQEINNIKNEIGSATLNTDAINIKGAINEVNSKIEINKTNVEGALEEVNSRINGLNNYDDTQIRQDINNVKTEIGTEELTTTDQTIKGAVNEVNSQINKKVNFSDMKYSYLENDSMICVTYDNENPRNYKLMITFDGVIFNKIDDLELEGWDYCLAYHNGYYYLSYDYMSSDFNPSDHPYFVGANKIAILKTKDFITYDKIDVQLPSFFKQTWGPELFFKSNNLHMFFSGCDLTDTSTDSEGVTQYIKHTYHTVSTDNGLTWSKPVKINLLNGENVIDEGNKIDPSIIENNGKYYLFLKNEHEKFIEEYESETIDGDYKLINTLKDRYFVEAPAVCHFNDMYYLYCDMYSVGIYVYYTSTDLKKWSKSNILPIAGNTVMRHFTPCKVYDKQLLKDIVKKKWI